MTQAEKARRFAALHVKGRPLVLYNIWDAGSARAVAQAGAPALATGSWSVAGAQGYGDGQAIPLGLVETIVARITATVDLPLTVDFEGGYGVEPAAVARNIARIVKAGAIGVNFEDGVIGGDGVHDIDQHCARIRAMREAADGLGVPLFINARTDVFLRAGDAHGESLVAEAEKRGAAYAEAGASGFFIPGLTDESAIGRICRASVLPVNVMMKVGAPPIARLAELGVARVSFGPAPFRSLMETLTRAAGEIYAAGGA
jgi:2-methylisocitrate lyase-like PEP mutase family enzyme